MWHSGQDQLHGKKMCHSGTVSHRTSAIFQFCLRPVSHCYLPDNATVIGWGLTGSAADEGQNEQQVSDVMLKAVLQVLRLDSCAEYFPFVSGRQLCLVKPPQKQVKKKTRQCICLKCRSQVLFTNTIPEFRNNKSKK